MVIVMMETPKDRPFSLLRSALEDIAPHLRGGSLTLERQINFVTNVGNQAMVLMAERDSLDLLAFAQRGDRTVTGHLIDFAEACYRKDYSRTQAFAALAGLVAVGPSEIKDMECTEIFGHLASLTDFILDPGERSRARTYLDFMTD
jgi:uncharacterized protein YjfI (DUF2170 family)